MACIKTEKQYGQLTLTQIKTNNKEEEEVEEGEEEGEFSFLVW